MTIGRLHTQLLWLLPLLLAAANQQSRIFGNIRDSSGRSLPGADVVIQSASTGSRWKTRADDNGVYSMQALTPGRYKVTVRIPGFRTVSKVGAALESDETHLDFSMELLGLHEVITVSDDGDMLDPTVSSSMLITRNGPGVTLPRNGGDYRVLFDLMPGVVTTAASVSDAGNFTSNGQRPNSNVFRVDGMSVNNGVGSSILPGAFPGASLPAMNALGSIEGLASNESVQSMELRTSDFSPEFSNRPGAESLINTRSGSNEFREELFGNVRDSGWNARDWFANSRDIAFPRPSYYRLGAVFGGPLWRNRAFYSLAADASQLNDTGIQLTSVPSYESRRTAPDRLKQILSYYPEPIGPELGGGEAEGIQTVNDTGLSVFTSLRLDHTLKDKGSFFVRLVESPSKSLAYFNRFSWASATAGYIVEKGHGIHDLRINYSRADLLYSSFGGGPSINTNLVLTVAGVLPGYSVYSDGILQYSPAASASFTSLLVGASSRQIVTGLSVPGLGQFLSYGSGQASQGQWELRHTYSKSFAKHGFRVGADFITLEPSRDSGRYAILGVASSLEGLINNKPIAVTASSLPERGNRTYQLSLFAQDTFRISETVCLLYGMSWDITPPSTKQAQAASVSGLWTGTEWQTVGPNIISSAPWPTRYGQFAPRAAVAYRLPLANLTLRAGGGLYHDATLGAAINPINGAPFNSWLLSTGGSSSNSSTGIGTGSTQPPVTPDLGRFLAGVYPSLRLPTSYQWKISLERELGSRGVGSVAYVGSIGQNLLGHEASEDPSTGLINRTVALTQNSSSYNALQIRYSGLVIRNLFGSASYTWAHSIDNGSQDSSVFLIHPGYDLNEARGSSIFDVRQVLTAALSYGLPRNFRSINLPPALAGWNLSGTVRVRSGFPVDVLTTDQPLGLGFDNVGRPNLVPGKPVWLRDPKVAGGRRLNPEAFSIPESGKRGTLGRNSIAGNGFAQIDMSLRREFPLPWGKSVEVGLNMFNVLNHPAFADPVPFISRPWFGQSTSMQNLMLGSGSPNTGLPPLFQNGGPRSAEITFRISF